MHRSSLLSSTALLVLLISGLTACRTPPPPSRERLIIEPAGIVQRVNFAEKYLVFEASHLFATGEELVVMRDGRPAGRVRVLSIRRKRIQSADILEGAPRVGDIVERFSAPQP